MSNRVRLGLGLLISLVAALLLILGVIESGWAAVIGIIGIGVIASSARSDSA